MRQTLSSLPAILMLLALGAGAITATGRAGTDLGGCTNDAEDQIGAMNASRWMEATPQAGRG